MASVIGRTPSKTETRPAHHCCLRDCESKRGVQILCLKNEVEPMEQFKSETGNQCCGSREKGLIWIQTCVFEKSWVLRVPRHSSDAQQWPGQIHQEPTALC